MILRSAAGGQLVKVSTQTAQTPKIVYLIGVEGNRTPIGGSVRKDTHSSLLSESVGNSTAGDKLHTSQTFLPASHA